MSECSRTFVARVGRYIPSEFDTEACWPALRRRTVSLSGLRAKIQHAMISVQDIEGQDLVDAFTPLVLSARLGDTSSCAWMVVFSARAAIFIMAALYAAEIAPPSCRAHLKNGNFPPLNRSTIQAQDCFSGVFKKRPSERVRTLRASLGSHALSIQ